MSSTDENAWETFENDIFKAAKVPFSIVYIPLLSFNQCNFRNSIRSILTAEPRTLALQNSIL